MYIRETFSIAEGDVPKTFPLEILIEFLDNNKIFININCTDFGRVWLYRVVTQKVALNNAVEYESRALATVNAIFGAFEILNNTYTNGKIN